MKPHSRHATFAIQVGLLIALLIAPALLLFNSCSDKPSAPAPAEEQLPEVDPQIVAWLQENALPFNTSKPGSGFADIAYLKDLVGSAHIVALGEATHGTKEFFETKHRILEYLVTQMGFTMFAMEANWPECNIINDFVQTGRGDPAYLLAHVYCEFWNAQEILDMILWMRQYNQNSGGAPKLAFYGFDMQWPAMAMDSVIAYLGIVDPPASADAKSLYSVFRPYQSRPWTLLEAPSSTKAACIWNVQTVYERLEMHESEYEEKAAPEQFAVALQSARMVVQAEVFATTGGAVRDEYMAENVQWLLNQHGNGAKAVLWAHNLHVGVGMGGTYLRRVYGRDLVVFGFDFYKGSFNAYRYDVGLDRGFGKQDSDIPPKDSYEYAFRATGIPRFFLDMREYAQSTSWISGPLKFREVGPQYDQSLPLTYYYEWPLPRVFDVVIYFQDTNASTMLF